MPLKPNQESIAPDQKAMASIAAVEFALGSTVNLAFIWNPLGSVNVSKSMRTTPGGNRQLTRVPFVLIIVSDVPPLATIIAFRSEAKSLTAPERMRKFQSLIGRQPLAAIARMSACARRPRAFECSFPARSAWRQ